MLCHTGSLSSRHTVTTFPASLARVHPAAQVRQWVMTKLEMVLDESFGCPVVMPFTMR